LTGEQIMSKARARERAKARAADKTKKRTPAADQTEQNTKPGHIDPRANSIKSPGSNFKGGGGGFGVARRGSARSG
jgi:hypothetical protein